MVQNEDQEKNALKIEKTTKLLAFRLETRQADPGAIYVWKINGW